MYYVIEQLVDYYGWTVDQAKRLTYREREHWYKRVEAKKARIRSNDNANTARR